jgi:hypothetical protein
VAAPVFVGRALIDAKTLRSAYERAIEAMVDSPPMAKFFAQAYRQAKDDDLHQQRHEKTNTAIGDRLDQPHPAGLLRRWLRRRNSCAQRTPGVNPRLGVMNPAERDAWASWPARVAAIMAADLGIGAHAMQTVLETHVRQHLGELADLRAELR